MVQVDDGTNGEAYILGAGFSRAISSFMPLTDELGRRLAERDPQIFAQLGQGSFEQWLSHRAEPQPYLSTAANLGRRAVFVEATARIGDALDASVAHVLKEGMPQWLGELIALWHLRNSQVLTFNYDPLVECAFDTLDFVDWRTGTQFAWGSLLNYNPRGMAGASLGEFDGTSSPHPSFRLWKLHGSTNWFWAPGDTSGASAMRIRLPGGFNETDTGAVDDYHWMAPGRERLLVPPSSLKSTYYDNPVTREIWSRAYEGLGNAEVLTMIGYSMPQTDLTTVGMITEAAQAGKLSEIRVVNRSPEDVARRLRDIVPDHVTVREMGGASAVADYVASLLQRAMAEAAVTIRDLRNEPEARVLVSWGDVSQSLETRGRTAGIARARRISSDLLVVETHELETANGATSALPGGPVAMRLPELQAASEGAKEIRVRLDGTDSRVAVIDAVWRRENTGQGNGWWVQLVPAGKLPQR